MSRVSELFKNGLIKENPTFVLLLGMCPTMAVSTSMMNAVGMGLSATVVLIGSNLIIALLRKAIPVKVRIAAFVVIIAGFVTTVDLILQAYFPAISKSLGVFIPLIVVNCIILGRAEAFASKNSVFDSTIDGIAMGLGFTFALSGMSLIREILGNGTFFGIDLTLGIFEPAMLVVMPCGGFLTLGCLIALVQWITNRNKPGREGAK